MAFKDWKPNDVSVFEFIFELYGSCFRNPYAGGTDVEQLHSQPAYFAHRLRILLQSILESDGEWASEAREVVLKFLEEAPETLSVLIDRIRDEQSSTNSDSGLNTFLSGKAMSRVVGLLTFFGDSFLGIFPGDKVLFQGKSASFPEEHVVLSYSDRNAIEESFLITSANRADKKINLERATAASISPDRVMRVRNTSIAIQRLMVGLADKIVPMLNTILVARIQESSSTASMFFGVLKDFALDTAYNLNECLEVPDFKASSPFLSTMTSFSSSLLRYLLVDFLSLKWSSKSELHLVPTSNHDHLHELLWYFSMAPTEFEADHRMHSGQQKRDEINVLDSVLSIGEAVREKHVDAVDIGSKTSPSSSDNYSAIVFPVDLKVAFKTPRLDSYYSMNIGSKTTIATSTFHSPITPKKNSSLSQSLWSALTDSHIFKSYKIFCQLSKIIFLREFSTFESVDLGLLYFLFKVAGLGQAEASSPLLRALFSNDGYSSSTKSCRLDVYDVILSYCLDSLPPLPKSQSQQQSGGSGNSEFQSPKVVYTMTFMSLNFIPRFTYLYIHVYIRLVIATSSTQKKVSRSYVMKIIR